MNNSVPEYQAIIVGGGAVGLFLGICLKKRGISCVVLEKRTEVRKGSRSLGIHPVSMELFDDLGISREFIRRGVKIYQGHAFNNRTKLGSLSFRDCPKPHNYVLALPQSITEGILENKLNALDADILKRNATVNDISQDEDGVDVSYISDGRQKKIRGDYLIGSDGKYSFVRTALNISFEGRSYPDTYIMGDFEDSTNLGNDAAIFLPDDGLIESFPLPGEIRRWVVKTEQKASHPSRKSVIQLVKQRTGFDLSDEAHSMLSSFGVEKRIARPIAKNRAILAGDAAHIVSPIGGQGMNLGWLGAWDLAQCLENALQKPSAKSEIFAQYERRRRKAYSNAARRAEMNMKIGRKYALPHLRNTIVKTMISKPLSPLFARIFTMRGVENWII